MANPVYKVDHRYNPSPAWVSEFSKARLEQSSSSSSFRAEIEQKLMHWRTLQNKKQCMEQQQRRTIQTEVKQHLETPTDDFERIMNEDLNQQLEALELEEQEQYQQLKTSIADDLKQRSIFEEHIQERIQIMKELDRLEEEEKKQREKLQKAIKNVVVDTQMKIWKRKQLMYVRQAIRKATQLKASKMLQLLDSYHKAKTYHLHRTKKI